MTGEKDPFDPHGDDLPDAEELQRILREMLSGNGGDVKFDPAQFAQVAGLPGDPAALGGMLETLMSALGGSGSTGDRIDWTIAKKNAIEVARGDGPEARGDEALAAFPTASLWLDEATEMGAPADAPKALSRVAWVQQTIDTWISMAEPVAHSISDTLADTLQEQLPEELSNVFAGADGMIRRVGGALFAMQLGQVVGKLSHEVISGGDVGIPLLSGQGREGGALLPDNLAAFSEGLEQPRAEIALYLAVRELAHARLFRHTKWLRLHLLTAIGEYAKGIELNTEVLDDLAHQVDPANPEEIQELLRNGSLIPPRSPRQEAAHDRLETMLALVDGWVDVVTAEATSRLPGADSLGEMVRRRRAAGGPSERAFSTLVGLELRPRRLREAAHMWRVVTEHGGAAARDGLWAHPDLLPTVEEITQPETLLNRMGLGQGGQGIDDDDDFDRELAKLLDDSD